MATYAIGDIQGCFDELRQLLDRIKFDPTRDRLWLCGDLVNRGPKSLEVLEFAYAHRDSMVVVLGNHDIHLLNRVAGVSSRKKRDTLGSVLKADNRDVLVDWLRHCPLVHREGDTICLHAGLLPAWGWSEISHRAEKVQARLASPSWREFLRTIHDGDSEDAESVAVMTRLRMVDKKGRPAWGFAGPPEEAPSGLTPWFDAKDRRTIELTVVFAHWAALGHRMMDRVVALDSACVWGGKLTAVRLEDRAVFQVGCES